MEKWESGLGKASSRCVRPKTCPHQVLNDQVFDWFIEVRSKKLPVTGRLIQEKAILVSKELGKDDFSASNGWLESWKQRYNIKFSTLCGEGAEVDPTVISDWSQRLSSICEGYQPEDIFNADETGLYYRTLPGKSMIHVNDSAQGVKICKDRLTALVACSFTGEKLPLMLIGKSANPRCFKGIEKGALGVRYDYNTKAWMTSVLFKNWLEHINSKMSVMGRSILLFIDNCPAHPDLTFSHVKLVYFPANTTSALQPCDAGIIQNLKLNYRKKMLRHILLHMGEANTGKNIVSRITVLDAIMWLKSSWDMVDASTISKCFRMCGFKDQPDAADQESDIQIIHDLQSEDQFEAVLGEISLESYAAIDCDVITTSMPDSMVPETADSENELDSETDPPQFCPEAADDMLKAIIREALATGEHRLMDMAIKTREELESKEIRRKAAAKKQLSISDFFKRQ